MGAKDLPGGKVQFMGKTYSSRSALPAGKIGNVENSKSKGRGWSRVGYSDVILLDGTREVLVKHNDDTVVDNNEITWGVASINNVSRHLCYIGGLGSDLKAKDTRTVHQTRALIQVIEEVLSYAPNILIAGHNQFDNKACPSFFVPDFLRAIGVPEKNIYTGDKFGYGKRFNLLG